MAGEGEEEAVVIERQLEQQLQEQRSSLEAVDEALAADPSNADLLEVHEELLAAIKDAEDGLLHLKRSRLMKQVDEIFQNQEAAPQSPEVAVEPLDPNDVEPEQLESHDFSVGSKCRFRHKDGRWYNGCIIGLEGSSDARISFLTPTSENMSINGSLLPASVIALYCTYLCYSGLSSEPRDSECNGLHNHSKAVSTGSLTLGLLTTVLSVVYSAVRAGSSATVLSSPDSPRAGADKPLLPFSKADEQEDKKDVPRPVTYSYSFFHLIFSLASMYSAMLLTGWSTSVGESGNLVDVGWPSVWVRILTQWATAGLYIWFLVAPFLFPDREF